MAEEVEGGLEDIRADDEFAIARMFREYGRGRIAIFSLGAVATVVSRAMELVPAYLLAIAIDSLFFDERPFGVWGMPAGWLPPDPQQQLLLLLGLLAVAYLLEAGAS